MDFDLSTDQRDLQTAARTWFSQEWSLPSLRQALDGADLPDLTPALGELGFLGILPSGGSVLDLALVCEEAGRTLAPTPMVGTAGRAATLLRAAGEQRLLDAVTTGTSRVAVLDGDYVATGDGAAMTVSGGSGLVLDARHADLLLVKANHTDGNSVVLVVEGRTGLTLLERPALDASRDLSGVTLDAASGRPLPFADPDAAWEHALDVATVLLAAEDLGALERVVEITVGYALERETFGRKIGSYQAVKHACVDMFVDQELVRSLIWLAAWTADENPEELAINASSARSFAATALEKATEAAIQIHGGIGFTWEHDAHLYWRRAKASRSLLGDVATHRDRIATLALAGSPS